MAIVDPLELLPAEIVLRIIDFTSVPGVAQLTRASKAWHEFIDSTHQDAIYSSSTKTNHPPASRGFAFLGDTKSFAKYFDGVTSWKDLCKRQTLLDRNWACGQDPITRESVLQVGNDAVWRFRPDFKRRFFVSTSQSGGVNVTDMDDGQLLWRLPKDVVRPFAHLEYQDGMAVWDRWGNALEVWKADDDARGVFRRVAVLQHDCETRGFQLSYDTLCVVSVEGQGFVYDMTQDPPQRRTHLNIENEAVGHLDQNEHVVMYSMGQRGYFVHSKDSGDFIGVLQPKLCANIYHIKHSDWSPSSIVSGGWHTPSPRPWPPAMPSRKRLTPLHLEAGDHPSHTSVFPLEEDEWGAGMLSGNIMVGVSRGGRIFICSDWRGALRKPDRAAATSAIIQCESEESQFDLGGWLSIKNGRCLFEVKEKIYIFTLPTDGLLPQVGEKQGPIYAASTSSAPQLAVPVSFMAVFDDCIMSTYTVSFHALTSICTLDPLYRTPAESTEKARP